jgi:hypothetical protein
MHPGVAMKTMVLVGVWVSSVLGIVGCGASSPPPPSGPPPVVPGTEQGTGMMSQQRMADADVVERIAAARCDSSQSCDRIGPGAKYPDRAACLDAIRTLVSRKLNTRKCPGGLGEIGVDQCVKSIRDGQCVFVDEVYPTASHCKLEAMCLP